MSDLRASHEVRFVAATEDDAPLILEFIRDLAAYERLAHEVETTEAGLRQSLFGAERSAEVVFAYVGEEPAAFALYFHNYSTFLGRRGMYLEDLFVRPRWRGRGIGRRLLAHLARVAIARGCGRLEWWVLDWNEPAIRFYRSLDARAMDEWTVFRLTGEPLRALALESESADREREGVLPATGQDPGTHGTTRRNERMGNDAKELIKGLNDDLRGELQAVIMYRLYASMVQGPYRQELRAFFEKEIPEELGHAQILADKISALGGTPVAEPAKVTVVSEPKQMLQAALDAEVQTIQRYVERRKQAESAGEHGLAAQFDDIIADETSHRDELRQMLARWP